ncbi:unnamed protein product [Caenorhabditis angaria]|uniref:Uncharacterized protein n=1 Tax=Caenorhabditis angaria TaxID=860376 RepID=A0A9P1IYX0_9PELO|nr:unnamed protein product [Caenorhabditis angaria]
MTTPPWMSLCGFGIIHDYPANSVGLFLIFLLSSAATIRILLEHRMECLVSFIPRKFYLFAKSINYFYTLTQFLVIFSYIYSYQDFRNQMDLKIRIDKENGPLPNFIFCENCLVFNLDSSKSIIFALTATFSAVIAAISIILMALASYHALSSNTTMFSKSTMIIQKSFLRSLFIQLGVHIIFLVSPIIFFFSAFLLKLSMEKWQIVIHFLTLCFFQHGSFSTIAMLSTNKQLKRNLNQIIRKISQRSKLTSKNESMANTASFVFQQMNRRNTRTS